MKMKRLESGYDGLGLLTMTVMMLVVSCPCTVKGQRTVLRNVNVGLILDTKSLFGKMGLSTLKLALSDFYASNTHFTTRILLHSRHSSSDVVDAAASALELIKNKKVQAIIGPQTSMQANFVINLGSKAQVPIITFSAKSPTLASIRSPFFFRVAANDSSQVGAIAAVVKAFGWRQVVPIYVDNEYGEGVIPHLTDALQSVDARVPYRSVVPPEASDDFIAAELYKLMTMSTRVFVVHSLPDLGDRIFAAAKRIGMMSKGYVWIVSDGIADFFSSQNSTVIETMQGVLGVKTFVPRSERLESFVGRWKAEFQKENPTVVDDTPMVVFGLWAYDAVFALAMAIEETSKTTAKFGFKSTRSSNGSQNSTDLESLSVSRSGARLAKSLSSVRFRGLSGDFKLVNGQLQTPNYEIVNVFGRGERRLGYWTVNDGLTQKLGPRNKTTTYSARNTSLGLIIWPGDSTSPPKGWQIPTNGKILRIGVPVKTGFQEFVKVSIPFSNDTVFGYTIDVFRAVLGVMPYAVPFEFVAFEGSYDNLVYQVFDEKFDAVVGDVTIRNDRSSLVDFTLPFTESGVSMIVPIKDYKSRNAWVFLKPLTGDLWAATVSFFVFIGFMVWVLEHRRNMDFQGTISDQVGTSLWYSFSTMVFGHREKVVSNSARFVVIIWCFVVLILTQSYTASLTSRLTVQQLRPVITDVNQLLKNGENVGYQTGSFVVDLLKDLGFKDDQLKVYDSTDKLFSLFENGITKGGISAAFDETPYTKLFLAKHCSKFTMVEPTFKADGFAFAFPKGSPLVPDVSRAILQVTEGQQMKDIEAVWFKKQPTCPDPSTLLSSDRLSLENFWGLFLIAGAASAVAFIATIAKFLHDQRDTLMRPDSMWNNIRDVFNEFNRFHENENPNGAQVGGTVQDPSEAQVGGAVQAPNGARDRGVVQDPDGAQDRDAVQVPNEAQDRGFAQELNSNGSTSRSSGSTTPLTGSARHDDARDTASASHTSVPKDGNVASSSGAQESHETEMIDMTKVG